MLEQGQVYTLEFQNFRRKHSNRAVGEVFLIEVEVSEEEWHYLADFPRDAIGNAAIQWTERTAIEEQSNRPQPRARQRQPQNDALTLTTDQQLHGRMWSALIYKRGFCNAPGVREALEDVRETTDDQPADLLHRLFDVEHMRDVTAAAAIEKFAGNQAAKTMIEQALRAAGSTQTSQSSDDDETD